MAKIPEYPDRASFVLTLGPKGAGGYGTLSGLNSNGEYVAAVIGPEEVVLVLEARERDILEIPAPDGDGGLSYTPSPAIHVEVVAWEILDRLGRGVEA